MQLHQNIWLHSSASFSPTTLVKLIKDAAEELNNDDQQDAHQFFITFVELIDEGLQIVRSFC